MKTNFEIVMEIKERPALFLGYKSFIKLIDFTCGYELCLYNLKLQKTKGIFEGFEDFVKKYYNVTNIHKPWPKIIELFSISDENAFDEFFRMFDLFLIDNPKLVQEEMLRQEEYRKITIT